MVHSYVHSGGGIGCAMGCTGFSHGEMANGVSYTAKSSAVELLSCAGGSIAFADPSSSISEGAMHKAVSLAMASDVAVSEAGSAQP